MKQIRILMIGIIMWIMRKFASEAERSDVHA